MTLHYNKIFKNIAIVFLVFAISFSLVSCLPKKEQIIFVFDHSGILDSSQNKKMQELYSNHEKKTTNEIVLMTTNSYYPDSTIETYALKTFRTLGIGKEGIDNGVLIVFSYQMRQVRISTGYGTEKILTDTIAKKIIDSFMVPSFKKQKYFEGLWNASVAITNFLEKPENKIK